METRVWLSSLDSDSSKEVAVHIYVKELSLRSTEIFLMQETIRSAHKSNMK